MKIYTLTQYRTSEVEEIRHNKKSTILDLQLESGALKTVSLSDIVKAETGRFHKGFRVAVEIKKPGVCCALQFDKGVIKYRFGAPAKLEKLIVSPENRRYSLVIKPLKQEDEYAQRDLPLTQWTGIDREGFFGDGS